jgi:Transposase IS4
LNIGCTGTTRKNAEGVPSWLIELKKNNRNLVWDSMLAEQVDQTLCFLWQDNNAVLGMTTMYDLTETIPRLRKRPAPTSTNARIVRPIFGESTEKQLLIPQIIDDYNHYMNGVDTANQLRKTFTVQRKFEQRIWRPQWYFLFDVCLVNSYQIYKHKVEDPGRRLHRKFQEELADILMAWPYEEIPNQKLPNLVATTHEWEKFQRRGYCLWCTIQNNRRKRDSTRPILSEIVNEAAPRPKRVRPTQSRGGCLACNVHLHQDEACFEAYHSKDNNK